MPEISVARLRTLFDYDPETGHLIRKVTTSGNAIAGSIAGTKTKLGYIAVNLDGVPRLAHRLIWAIVTGKHPVGDVDHRDRCRSNNRWDNLRESTRSQNQMNRSSTGKSNSGRRGVSWKQSISKWQVYITVNKKQIALGYYSDLKEAIKVREEAEERYFGAFKG